MQIQYDLFKEFTAKIKNNNLDDYKWRYFNNYLGQIVASHVIAEDQYDQQLKFLYENNDIDIVSECENRQSSPSPHLSSR